jgi:menaquinol-cytochrome c reductase iron-sulfur subunit
VPTAELSRRRFYIGAIYSIWAGIAAALGIPALVYLFLPPRVRHEDPWVDVGDISQVVPGAPVEMTFRRNRVDGWKVIGERSTAWVVRGQDQSITAFGPQCTHLGCAYHWEESKNEFVCPCHNSIFAVDGRVVSGPAPRPLDRYEAKVEGTHLLLGRLEKPESKA